MKGILRKAAAFVLSMTVVLTSTLANPNGWQTVYAADESGIVNGDFETGSSSGWTITPADVVKVKTDEWAANNTTNILNIFNSTADTKTVTVVQSFKLDAGTYTLSIDNEGKEDGEVQFTAKLTNNSSQQLVSMDLPTTTGWDVWQTKTSNEFTVAADNTAVTLTITGSLPGNYWGDLDNIKISKKDKYADATPVDDAGIYVERVKYYNDDFALGMDISSAISLFESGVTFKDDTGKTINNITDFCKYLASKGVTHIRIRVWNDPYDASGNGYGGGNNDVAKAKLYADACRAAGLKMLVDFHCSDLWTDPGKQQAPKAWAKYSLEQKATALTAFLEESLNTIDPKKNVVTMVQVGNETTTGFVGESGAANMCTLFSAGAVGVRAYNPAVQIVIHVTNPEKGSVTTWASSLNTNGVDYDILATSYYPYWHGTLDNLKSAFKTVRNTYGKKVMVAETSYAYTLEDSDGHANTVRVGNNDTNIDSKEPFSVQGQATQIRNVVNAVNEAGGIGVFYWEPAWLTVGNTTGLEGAAYEAQVTANKQKWETHGSGWASSYAATYEAKDAGQWFGGSAVDNEAMFYPDGTPTAAINVWRCLKTGAAANDVSVDSIAETEVEITVGDSVNLPAQIQVSYSSGNVNENVVWNTSTVNNKKPGTYTVTGIVSFSKSINMGDYKGLSQTNVTATVKVVEKNLLSTAVSSFESGADSYYTMDNAALKITTDDPRSGSKSLHWYSASANTATATYTSTIELEAGKYVMTGYAQGEAGDKYWINVADVTGAAIATGTAVQVVGWNQWQQAQTEFTLTKTTKIKYAIVVEFAAGGWGTIDDLKLYKKYEETPSPKPTPSPSPSPSYSGGGSSSSGSSGGETATDKAPTADKTPDKNDTNTEEKTPAETNIQVEKTEDKVIITDGDGKPVAKEIVQTADGDTYITNAKGEAYTNQIVKVDGKKYFAKEDGVIAIKEFVTTAKGNTVYAGKDGKIVVNQTFTVGGKKYFASESGAIAKSTFVTTIKGNTVYAKANGALVTNKVFKVEGKQYVAAKSGAIVKSKWVTINNVKYYCNKKGVVTKTKKK